jgi:hypothetical protein
MNEKVKQLAKQAYEDVISNTPSMLVTREMFEQRFAELVIKRCCEIADEAERADVPVVSSKFIKAHFGVK